MKNIRFVLISCLTVCMLVNMSCESEFLDKSPDEDITIEEAFQQRRYAEGFLTSIYAGLPNEIYFTDMADINPFVVASDELNIPWPEKFAKLMNQGSWNAYNVTGRVYINMYEGIRKANIFLENIHLTPTSAEFTSDEKQRWIGEARFLRMFYHFQLLRIYGPITIMDKAALVDDDFLAIRRNTLEESIQFIVDECDHVISMLPMTIAQDRNIGRPTAAAALAVKARVLLYAASPLWNGNPDYTTFVDDEGTRLFPQTYNAEKWNLAATAALDAIRESEAAGYALFKKYNDPVQNYQQLFLERNNSEVLFARNCGRDRWMEACAFPGSLGGWNGWNPTQGQVDAYEMENGMRPITGYNADGSPQINAASGYVEEGYAEADDPQGRWLHGTRNMYVNRDPRFYASINFNGAYFVNRRVEFWESGADGRRVSGRDHNTTGYLLKKFIDPDVSLIEQRHSLKTWIYFRLGELYLNYAEALNEYQGPVSDVYTYVNAIRNRAGMPDLPEGLSQEEMRQRIRNERRVELSYETHRYFDTIRWKIAAQTNNGPIFGMNISAGTHLQDDEFYKRTVVENRVFRAPQHYLFPIPQTEIDRLPSLMQNPGW